MGEYRNPAATFTVAVGYTTQRPVIPDQHTRWYVIALDEDDPVRAQLVAAQWNMCRPECVMPTSTRIVSAVL